MNYKNGRVPLGLLVPRPARGGTCLMMPGTAAKHDKLVELARREHGWTPLVSGPDDAYRTYAVQVRYKAELGWMAASPGTSSHGGTFEGRQCGAVDYGNWGQVGQGAFFDLAWRAGFEPGYFMGQAGRPVEPWHLIDRTPWDVPPARLESKEDEMPDSMFATVDGVPSWCWLNWSNGAVYAVHTQGEADWVSSYMGSVRDNFGGDPDGGTSRYKSKLALLKMLNPGK